MIDTAQERTLVDDAVEHPRPQLRRENWFSLNGQWDFCKGRHTTWATPGEVQWETSIIVPFSPETEASGVHDTGFYTTVWYRRVWQQVRPDTLDRIWLHFEAVDWRATVWVNGKLVCSHEGGYTPFGADITDAFADGPEQEVIVRADDDAMDLAKPRGKQDWLLEPHSIWYPRTTGIWQSVWLEIVPPARLHELQWTSSLDRWEIGLEGIVVEEPHRNLADEHSPLQLSVRLEAAGQLLAHDTYAVIAGEVHRRIALSDPGIDDYRNTILWSPSSPTLIDAQLELRDGKGNLLDSVRSYTALRSVAIQGDRFILNGRPLQLRLVLDQGYWLNSGLTAPDDKALIQDVNLAKRLGFNGVRKHQKIECARYLYWADRIGLLVWEEMPSAYRYTTKSIQRLTREWIEVVHRDKSHPCIIAWVPFNESWGVPDLPDSQAQRHYVQSLYHLTKTLDPSRPVIGNDGWESVATDMIGIHDYDVQPARIGKRYGVHGIESNLLKRERPGGRMLALGKESVLSTQPIVLTEFGGIAYAKKAAQTWGYSSTQTAEELLAHYTALLQVVRNLPALAGFCYTQFTDTYQEANGLLYADRTPKAPLDSFAEATSGVAVDPEHPAEAGWEEKFL